MMGRIRITVEEQAMLLIKENQDLIDLHMSNKVRIKELESQKFSEWELDLVKRAVRQYAKIHSDTMRWSRRPSFEKKEFEDDIKALRDKLDRM
jgi:hypothetical protein